MLWGANNEKLSDRRITRSDRFECWWLNVVFPCDSIVRVSEDHSGNRLSNPDTFEVRRQSASKAVPTLPFDPAASAVLASVDGTENRPIA